jgi:hypothetical protein
VRSATSCESLLCYRHRALDWCNLLSFWAHSEATARISMAACISMAAEPSAYAVAPAANAVGPNFAAMSPEQLIEYMLDSQARLLAGQAAGQAAIIQQVRCCTSHLSLLSARMPGHPPQLPMTRTACPPTAAAGPRAQSRGLGFKSGRFQRCPAETAAPWKRRVACAGAADKEGNLPNAGTPAGRSLG